jgi:hypothetical protein
MLLIHFSKTYLYVCRTQQVNGVPIVLVELWSYFRQQSQLDSYLYGKVGKRIESPGVYLGKGLSSIQMDQ